MHLTYQHPTVTLLATIFNLYFKKKIKKMKKTNQGVKSSATANATENVAKELLDSIHEAIYFYGKKQPVKFNAVIVEKIIPQGNQLIQELNDVPNSLTIRASLKNIINSYSSNCTSLKSNLLNGAASRISGQFSPLKLATENAIQLQPN